MRFSGGEGLRGAFIELLRFGEPPAVVVEDEGRGAAAELALEPAHGDSFAGGFELGADPR